MLKRKVLILRSGLPGTDPVVTTWGSCKNIESATAHRIHNRASSFRLRARVDWEALGRGPPPWVPLRTTKDTGRNWIGLGRSARGLRCAPNVLEPLLARRTLSIFIAAVDRIFQRSELNLLVLPIARGRANCLHGLCGLGLARARAQWCGERLPLSTLPN